MYIEKYISIGLLAQETGLSRVILKRLALDGRIPALKTSRRLLFKMSAVQAALDELAMSGLAAANNNEGAEGENV